MGTGMIIHTGDSIDQKSYNEALTPGKVCPCGVRTMAEEWRVDYNTERPHKSLDKYCVN